MLRHFDVTDASNVRKRTVARGQGISKRKYQYFQMEKLMKLNKEICLYGINTGTFSNKFSGYWPH